MLQNYKKIRSVGRGAYGTVFLCRRLCDDKQVIIKQIPVEQMTADERQAALNEVTILKMLNHPNIIEYYESFLEDQAMMIVMEYAEGGTLHDYLQLRKGQLLEEKEVLHLFVQMLLSLHHVHSKQILHRDLKTQNILLDHSKECVKIGDFGISKLLSSRSKAHSVVGTPCYISPELCEGKPYNQKSDIWALGCVLYELSSLKRAFEAQNLPALVLKIMRGQFDNIDSSYSNDLKELILSMLHLNPLKRPSVDQLLSKPMLLNVHTSLYIDLGMIKCRSNKSHELQNGQSKSINNHNLHINGNLSGSGNSNKQPYMQSTVYYWGSGQLLPTILNPVSNDQQIKQVSSGMRQKAAVTECGKLLLWETTLDNSNSIPGSPDGAQVRYIPRYIESQIMIKDVACGDLFIACLTDRGILMTLGSGATGCLGHGNHQDVIKAKIVEKLLGSEVVQVSCGASHVLAVTNLHKVYSWGRGDNGRLGLGNHDSQLIPCYVRMNDLDDDIDIPEKDDSNLRPQSVFCGHDCSMIIDMNGKLLCTGNNRFNKLGLDTDTKQIDEVDTFQEIQTIPLHDIRFSTVSMGNSHSAVITRNGECYTFGSNQFDQLGIADTEVSPRRPQRPYVLNSKRCNFVSCGDTFTVVVTEDNLVYSWGKSSRGRLGRLEQNCNMPQLVILPHEFNGPVVTSLSSSHGTTLLAVSGDSHAALSVTRHQ